MYLDIHRSMSFSLGMMLLTDSSTWLKPTVLYYSEWPWFLIKATGVWKSENICINYLAKFSDNYDELLHARGICRPHESDVSLLLSNEYSRKKTYLRGFQSMKMECDYLYGWIKNGHISKNLTKTGRPQRHSWERRRRWRFHSSINL